MALPLPPDTEATVGPLDEIDFISRSDVKDGGSASVRLVIVGAGPTGLGAAHRLRELGYDGWVVLEAAEAVGGLARSYTDADGFTYDIGGHVLFSHYRYYDDLLARLLNGACTEIRRDAWIWMEGRYIPYPFQNHLRGLSPQTVYECLRGLVATQRQEHAPGNFREWAHATFGDGIARHFMIPYNEKVWAIPPERMGFDWISERVSVIDVDAVLRNVVLGEEQVSWGPNSAFRYPLRGGTGYLFERLGQTVAERLELGCAVVAVDPAEQVVVTGDGRRWHYEALLSTMPLDDLVACCRDVPDAVRTAAADLVASSTHVVGVALDRPADTSRTWVYYPEPAVPFYRTTYLSNYSPFMTARPGQTLLLTETSTSSFRPEDPTTIVERVVDGLVRVGVMTDADRGRIVGTWHCLPSKTYPVPTLGRDAALAVIQPWLQAHRIWSRGRFGAWRYEIGNMDHSVMQGVQWAEHVVSGSPESVWSDHGD